MQEKIIIKKKDFHFNRDTDLLFWKDVDLSSRIVILVAVTTAIESNIKFRNNISIKIIKISYSLCRWKLIKITQKRYTTVSSK